MDEVAKRIYIQRAEYWKAYGRKPNIVLLGIDTLDQLKDESYFITNTASVAGPARVFGMDIEQVHRMEYLAVGHVMKEVKLDDKTVSGG